MKGGTNRRLDQPRETTLAAALELIGEKGLAGMTMSALGKRLGTSGGHLLYYFGSKDQLLLETLRWSEDGYEPQRRALLSMGVSTEAIVAFADLFLPTGKTDERWLLWLDLWARAAYDDELATAQRELDHAWRATLESLLEAGSAAGVFDATRLPGWADRVLAMLDGFGIAIVTGAPLERAHLLAQVREMTRPLETANPRL